eukprot:TRINITY_DN16861_c0_g1_i8.p1 TRINITY_DN16861_c0_g1~~TRINITY_DN16861_c0_g1_i8.p1  ORF type:complete len:625 (-),score=134.08 TRINITY_DN16861_c0_g1_i8:450-2246(-)
MFVPTSLLTAFVLASASAHSASNSVTPTLRKLKENTCKCDHGTEATGKECTVDGEEKCTSCESGFRLIRDKCNLSYAGIGYMTIRIRNEALKRDDAIELANTSSLSKGMTIKITNLSSALDLPEHNKIAEVDDSGKAKLENPLKYSYDVGTTVVTVEESSWSPLDGKDRACRVDASDSTVSGHGTVQTHSKVQSFEECKRLCHMKIGCTGVEFQASRGYCEIWTLPIGYTVSKPGFQCWRHGQDCITDLSMFELKWPRARKIWCCYHQGKGCSSKQHEPSYQAGIGYYWEKLEEKDTKAVMYFQIPKIQFVTWERRPYVCNLPKKLPPPLTTWNTWTYAHKLWCCKTESLPKTLLDHKEEYEKYCHQDTSTMPPEEGMYWQKLGEDGFSFWNATHEGYHWKKVDGTLVEVPFDCNADLDRFERVWTSEQKKWCCNFLYKGCSQAKKPIYGAGDGKYWKKEKYEDGSLKGQSWWKPEKVKYRCDADLERFELMWTKDQKKWCCEELGKGCSDCDKEPKYPAGTGFYWECKRKTWERKEAEAADCDQKEKDLTKGLKKWCYDFKHKAFDGEEPPYKPPPQGTRWVKANRDGHFTWELTEG